MELDACCSFEFAVPTATHAIMLVEPHSSELQRVVGARLDIVPHAPSIPYVDSFDNRRRRLTQQDMAHVMMAYQRNVHG